MKRVENVASTRVFINQYDANKYSDVTYLEEPFNQTHSNCAGKYFSLLIK